MASSATADALRAVKALLADGPSFLSTEWLCERVVRLIKPTFWEEDAPGSGVVAAAKQEIVRLLMSHFRITSFVASAVLVEACDAGCCPTFAQALLAAGAHVHHRWHYGRTALHASMRPDTAKILIAAGGDVNSIDNRDGSPLFRAAYFSAETTALLLGAGADPNLSFDRGRTAMFEAVLMLDEGRGPDASLILLRHGARLDIRCEQGWGPLDKLLAYPDSYGWITPAVAATYKAGDSADTTASGFGSASKTACVPVAALLVEEAAWYRRRHLMVAFRKNSA